MNRPKANAHPSSTDFATKRLPVQPSDTAPDGLDVRTLLQLGGGSLAHFELAPGKTSNAVAHHTIEEIWYFVDGQGEIWRQQNGREEVVPVERGVCVSLPVGTRFQLRSFGYQPLAALAITMPPWPGADEAYSVKGKWTATVGSAVKAE